MEITLKNYLKSAKRRLKIRTTKYKGKMFFLDNALTDSYKINLSVFGGIGMEKIEKSKENFDLITLYFKVIKKYLLKFYISGDIFLLFFQLYQVEE